MGRLVCWLLSTSPSDAREGSEHGPLRACSPELQMGEKGRGGKKIWQSREVVGVGNGGNCVKHGGVSLLLRGLPVLSSQTSPSTNLGLKSAWAQLKAYRVASKQTKEDDNIFTHSQAL